MQPEPLRHQNSGDPATELLDELPEKYRQYFLAEYEALINSPDTSTRSQEVAELLRHWHLRALMYNQPGYEERLAAAVSGDTSGDVPIEDLVPAWPRR